MPKPQFPLINGFLYSFATINIDIGGVPMVGIKALNFKEEWGQEGEFATSPVAAGKAAGQYKNSLDFEVLRESWDYLVELLGDGYGAVPFNVGAQWEAVGRTEISAFEAQGATISGNDASNSGGAAVVKVTCSVVIPFRQNGRYLVPQELWASLGIGNGLGSVLVGGASLGAGFLSI